MRNIKTYSYFLKNINCSFKIKFLRVFLTRTYIFNVSDNSCIIYRKDDVKRKLSLVGKSRLFFTKNKIDFSKLDYSKYNIKSINSLLFEYISNNYLSSFSLDSAFDILESKKMTIVNVDSFIRKFSNDEVVTMRFDDKDYLTTIMNNKINKDFYSINV